MKNILFAIFISLGLVGNASAYGKNGHAVIAKLAEKDLSEKTKAALKDLGFDNLSDSASWADTIKRDPKYRNTSRWHYIQLPYDKIETVEDVKAYREAHPVNLLNKTQDMIDTLKSKKASKAKKREALKFLVHFIGDINQPLHCINNKDNGGNAVKLVYNGKKTNLHVVWDSLLVNDVVKEHGGVDELADRLYEDSPIIKPLVEDEINLDFYAFASFNIAKVYVYNSAINEVYIARSKEVVKVKMTIAGARLAFILNSIFEGK